jgi:hypothetical protein
MRLYVPATVELLARWHAAGEVPATDPGMLGAYEAPDDTEEGEYAALMSAADASVALLAGPGRRVVLVVESGPGDRPAPARTWQAVHADPGDRPAGADPDEDLGWFATQEIGDLIS